MKISKILSEHRNDFTAEMTCEFCGHESRLGSGYNDSYYHNTVIPNMKCGVCRKSSNDLLKVVGKAFDYSTGHLIE